MQNAYIESFNGKLWNDCLNLEWVPSTPEAQRVIEEWRVHIIGADHTVFWAT